MNDTDERVEVKSILVAVDGSEHSLKAVRYACAIGSPLGAEVVLLHVVPMLVSATPYHDTVSDQPFLSLQKVGEPESRHVDGVEHHDRLEQTIA